MEIIIIWGMFLVLATTELSFNQVMSLDTIMVVLCSIDYGVLILTDTHLITIVIQIIHLTPLPLAMVLHHIATDNH